MISFEIVKDLPTAERLWKLLSPDQTIFDTWDFRYCFYKYFNYELFFYVGKIEDEIIGLLPLQFNSDKGYLEFFGGSAMENNQIFIKSGCEKYISEFYKQLDKPSKLQYIIGDDLFTTHLPIQDYKYTLPLDTLTKDTDYIEQYFQGETKKKLKKRLKKFEEEHTIEMITNEPEDIELLFQFNTAKFQGESIFQIPHRREIFHDLTKSSFPKYVLTFLVDGTKQAVGFAILYKGVYVSFSSGINPAAPKNLSSNLHIKKIDHAISIGAKVYDAMIGDCGWKENWHFVKSPQYQFGNEVPKK